MQTVIGILKVRCGLTRVTNVGFGLTRIDYAGFGLVRTFLSDWFILPIRRRVSSELNLGSVRVSGYHLVYTSAGRIVFSGRKCFSTTFKTSQKVVLVVYFGL